MTGFGVVGTGGLKNVPEFVELLYCDGAGLGVMGTGGRQISKPGVPGAAGALWLGDATIGVII